jgi:hypothetical protein
MAAPKRPSAEVVTSPTLDLKWSLTLRVVTVALFCFVIAAAITLVGTYRDVRRANENLAEVVVRRAHLPDRLAANPRSSISGGRSVRKVV